MKDFAEAQQIGRALAALPHRCVGRRRAVADRHDEALAHDQMGLAEGDGAVDELRRPQHHEQHVAIEFELRPLMRLMHVLDQELVQVELRLYDLQELLVRLVQAEPQHGVAALGDRAAVADRHLDAAPVAIGRTGDDAAGFLPAAGGRHTQPAQRPFRLSHR